MTALIVIVSADREYARLVAEALRDAGYTVICCVEGHLAHETIRRERPAVVLLDVWLEHPRGGEMVLGMLHIDPATRAIPVIVCPPDKRSLAELAEHLAGTPHRILPKPFNIEELLALVASLLAANGASAAAGPPHRPARRSEPGDLDAPEI